MLRIPYGSQQQFSDIRTCTALSRHACNSRNGISPGDGPRGRSRKDSQYGLVQFVLDVLDGHHSISAVRRPCPGRPPRDSGRRFSGHSRGCRGGSHNASTQGRFDCGGCTNRVKSTRLESRLELRPTKIYCYFLQSSNY